jgi:hydrogenase/urease accessory protein HupE
MITRRLPTLWWFPHSLMKNVRRLFLAGFLIVLVAQVTAPVQAHELLPDELVQYMQEHPDATEAEIEAFIQSSTIDNGDEHYLASLMETVFAGKTGFWHNAWSFIGLGVEHILLGFDHVLFVLALLLSFVSLRNTLKSVTAFTLAHSVTLILAGTGIVVLTPRIVEPIIALSIAFVAIGTVFLRRYALFRSVETKAGMIFLFGLFHGLGFAGLLQDFSIPEGRFLSSLLFFNVGIEIGQLLIIIVLLPIIYLFRSKAWYPLAIKIIAVMISAVALIWFIERVFSLSLIS